jgi:hypothetical protein
VVNPRRRTADDDAMQVAVVDVLTRHLIAQAREGIMRQLLVAKRN